MEKSIPQFNKTRISPTPSGYLHLGNALAFAITAALAKKTGAEILLRIDDLDRERVDKLYVQDIFDTLNFLEIPWHYGPRDYVDYETNWSQMHRMAVYDTYLQQLKQSGEIFACTCSRTRINSCTCRHKQIAFDTINASWRLHTNPDKELAIQTLDGGIIKITLPPSMQDFVIKKKDGYPSYQLTSVADDLYYGIDLIVRGDDLWPSTIAQHYLAGILEKSDFKKITFHHHSLITVNGEKLSKSNGATAIKYLREHGKTPTDIYNEMEKIK